MYCVLIQDTDWFVVEDKVGFDGKIMPKLTISNYDPDKWQPYADEHLVENTSQGQRTLAQMPIFRIHIL